MCRLSSIMYGEDSNVQRAHDDSDSDFGGDGPESLAQAYPAKPVRMIVGFAPGGGTDVTARAVVQELSEGLAQRVVIDNRPGANGVVATEITAKSPPDGYTILMVNLGHTVNPGLYPKLPYDTLKDFAPISLVATLPNPAGDPSLAPGEDIPEFVRLAKSSPARSCTDRAGRGELAPVHGAAAKGDEYEASARAVQERRTVGGSAARGRDHGVLQHHTVRPAVCESGALACDRCLEPPAIGQRPRCSDDRGNGLSRFFGKRDLGLVAPAGTPAEAINRIHAEVVKLLKLPAVVQRFATLGLDPVGNTPAEFAQFIKADMDQWTKLIRELKVTLQ